VTDWVDPDVPAAPSSTSHPWPAASGSLVRNLTMDLGVALAIGVMIGLITTLLPPMARQVGVGVAGLSLLAAVPYLAAVAGVATTRVGPRLPRDMFLTLAAGSLPVLTLLAWPSVVSILLLALTCWVAIWFLAPFQLRLWTLIYPGDRMGRFISLLGIARVAAGAAGVAAAGLLSASVGGPTAILIGLAGAVLLATAAFGFDTPRLEAAPRVPVTQAMRSFIGHAGLRRLAVAQIVWGIGAGAAIALFPFVQVDRLALSLTDIGLIGLIAAMGALVSYPVWGWLADRGGGVAVLVVASGLGAAGLVVWALADGFGLVVTAATLMAMSDAGLGVGQPVAVSERSSFHDVASHQAAWNGLVGIRGAVAPFLIAVPVAWGLLDVTGAILICAGASAMGCLMFVAAARTSELAGTQAERA
jgi:hypothetical protein